MKFLFVAPGLHKNSKVWIETFIKNNHDIKFFRWRNDNHEDWHPIKLEKIKVFRLYIFIPLSIFREPNFHFPNPFSLYKKIKDSNSDTIIARDPAYPVSFLSLLFGRLLKKKTIIYTQTPLHKKPFIIKKILFYFIIYLFKAYWITTVLGDKNNNKKFHKKAFYVPFPININNDIKKQKEDYKKINIISVGKLNSPRKNHILLLKSIHKLKKEHNIHLTIIGSLGDKKNYFNKIVNYIKLNNLDISVTIKHNIPYQKMLDEYISNDLFILPSSKEAAGYSLLEAMSVGLPVICSDTNGTKCYIEEGQNGYIFKSDNFQSLYERIKLIISDKEKMIDMSNHSLYLTKNNHSPEIFYRKFMEIINK